MGSEMCIRDRFHIDWTPAHFVGLIPPCEDLSRADINAESAGLAVILDEVNIPDSGVLSDLCLLSLKEGHRLPSSSRYKGVVGAMVTKLLPNGFCVPKKAESARL